MSTSRMNAVAAVTSYKPIEKPLNFSETPSKNLFGVNVFSDAVMKERLPKAVYKAMRRTIDNGENVRHFRSGCSGSGDARLGY